MSYVNARSEGAASTAVKPRIPCVSVPTDSSMPAASCILGYTCSRPNDSASRDWQKCINSNLMKRPENPRGPSIRSPRQISHGSNTGFTQNVQPQYGNNVASSPPSPPPHLDTASGRSTPTSPSPSYGFTFKPPPAVPPDARGANLTNTYVQATPPVTISHLIGSPGHGNSGPDYTYTP